MTATHGGWYTLLGIRAEQRQTTATYLAMRPTHCPEDGIQLVAHPRAASILHCPFCGYEPTSQDHP